jgi:dCMP deaminase
MFLNGSRDKITNKKINKKNALWAFFCFEVYNVFMKEEKPKNRPTWDEYFMSMLPMIGSRGTCDRGKIGCVATRDNRILVTGYAGAPSGIAHCDGDGHEMHTVVHEDGSESRHCIRTTHAEQNAICQAAKMGTSLDDGTLYCKTTPCYTCAKMIINVGIKRVVCGSEYHSSKRSKEIMKEAGVEVVQLSDELLTYKDQ